MLVLSICGMIVFNILSQDEIAELVDIAETEKLVAIQNLARLKKISIEDDKLDTVGEEVDVERVTDFGIIEENLGKFRPEIVRTYVKLRFLRKFNVKLEKYSYTTPDYNKTNPVTGTPYIISFSGKLLNRTGDIENLFTEFDSLVVEVKKRLKDSKVTYNELPKNIDFNKKYYDFPISFTIEGKIKWKL